MILVGNDLLEILCRPLGYWGRGIGVKSLILRNEAVVGLGENIGALLIGMNGFCLGNGKGGIVYENTRRRHPHKK